MKYRIFWISTVIFIILLGFPQKAYANCWLDFFNKSTRDLSVCVGEFNTIDDLHKTTANFTCVANSNWAPIEAGLCGGGLQNLNFTEKLTNAGYRQDTNGKYYTCITVAGLARAIGVLKVNFTGGAQLCTISPNIYTKPDDWNVITEGAPWQGDANTHNICQYANNDSQCIDCVQNRKGAWTAIGCVSTDPAKFVSVFLNFGIGIAGGLAFLLILFGGFQVMTSAGNPEKLNAGRELVTSAVAGLLLIIFSLFILRVIGVDIFGIPGFGKP